MANILDMSFHELLDDCETFFVYNDNDYKNVTKNNWQLNKPPFVRNSKGKNRRPSAPTYSNDR